MRLVGNVRHLSSVRVLNWFHILNVPHTIVVVGMHKLHVLKRQNVNNTQMNNFVKLVIPLESPVFLKIIAADQ